MFLKYALIDPIGHNVYEGVINLQRLERIYCSDSAISDDRKIYIQMTASTESFYRSTKENTDHVYHALLLMLKLNNKFVDLKHLGTMEIF